MRRWEFVVPCGLAAALAASCLAGGGVVYVDDDALAAGDGASWATAYRFLQDALGFAAIPDNDVAEIRVAGGVYLPDRSEATPGGTADRNASYTLLNGVAILGGFGGQGAANPDERDVDLFVTTLSGDLDLDDGPGFANNGDNAYQILIGGGTDSTAVIDGVTIRGGNANLIHDADSGAGLFIDVGSPTVVGCNFIGNVAGNAGGAIFSYTGGSPTIVGCRFLGNAAGCGGAIENYFPVTMTVVGCTFIGNTALAGGGMFNLGGETIIANCAFVDNAANIRGGGVLNSEPSSVTITNCTFTGNSALEFGGAIYNAYDPATTVANSILWSNTAPDGPDIALISNAHVSVLFSDVQGGSAAVFNDGTGILDWLAGNVDADPQFVNRLGNDGNPGTGDENVRLLSGSPCADAGDSAAVPPDTEDLDDDGDVLEPVPYDLDGNTRFKDDPCTVDTGLGDPPIVDMGAYEFQPCSGDIDGDCEVGITDFLSLLALWGPCDDCDNCPADLDGDCEVGITDFLQLLGNWGPCP